jgi:8-oxo-dGTP pyrophosphatase MutT (NUDIX family)
MQCQQEILLVKSWLGQQLWELPGGGAKAQEQPTEAAVRELREELKIHLKPAALQSVKTGIWRTNKLGFQYTIFIVTVKTKPAITTRRLEIISAQWSPVQQLPADVSIEVREAVMKQVQR